jgi:hypothetical protein
MVNIPASNPYTYTAQDRDNPALMQCRWSLYCEEPRTFTIHLDGIGDVDACDAHARDFLWWFTDADPVPYGDPPGPECWCTDADRGAGTYQRYCPTDGTPAERGLSPTTAPEEFSHWISPAAGSDTVCGLTVLGQLAYPTYWVYTVDEPISCPWCLREAAKVGGWLPG